jgi:hypothetical protein
MLIEGVQPKMKGKTCNSVIIIAKLLLNSNDYWLTQAVSKMAQAKAFEYSLLHSYMVLAVFSLASVPPHQQILCTPI